MWDTLLENIRKEIEEPQYKTWFHPLIPIKESQDLIELAVPDSFFKSWLEENFNDTIRRAISKSGQSISIHFTVRPDLFPEKEAISSKKTQTPKQTIKLNPKYRFENFVIGPSNRFAFAAATAVAQNPARAYNPFFIYGGVGLGKTHLMQAIAHYAIENSPGIKVHYISSEQFTNELIEAIQHRSTRQFREKYRNVDILLIDDIHFIAGKESTQEEFFHTFNALYDSHKQIIISSDKHPKEISTLEERLVSRFGWGLITDIQPPDIETRIAILKKKLEHEQVKIGEEVIHFIAENIKSNIRELEGALVRVVAFSIIEKTPITLGFAKEVLKDLVKAVNKKISLGDILECVAEYYSVPISDIKAKKRSKTFLIPRQVSIYLARELTEMSLPELGMAFGGKDHTTILHSYNKIKKMLNEDGEIKKAVEIITRKLEG